MNNGLKLKLESKEIVGALYKNNKLKNQFQFALTIM
jgi:hypothetical protein